MTYLLIKKQKQVNKQTNKQKDNCEILTLKLKIAEKNNKIMKSEQIFKILK